jgi:hypothetical protein
MARKPLIKRGIGFIETMDCLPVKEVPEGPEWTYELKLDGYRLEPVRSDRRFRLIPHRSAHGPLPRNLGAFCGQIAPMVAVLPVVPAHKYCAVYNLAQNSYHGMEEVIGSIPIRSTKLSLPKSSTYIKKFSTGLLSIGVNFASTFSDGMPAGMIAYPAW